jgi:hypothetical protein
VELGCRCPRDDNDHGHGTGFPGHFWVNQECPLHGQEQPPAPKPPEEEDEEIIETCPKCGKETLVIKAGFPYEIEQCSSCGYVTMY